MTKSVLVIGDLIDDVVVKPLSATKRDTDTEASITSQPGGQGANVASWLAAAGVNVDLVSRVSARDIERVNSQLSIVGVGNRLQADAQMPTGAIVVIVDGETRSFYTQRGANAAIDLDAISGFENYDLIYLSGYTITNSLDQAAVDGLLSRIRSSGKPLAIDPGSAAFIEQFGVGRFIEKVTGADFLFPSLEEGRLLSGESRPELIADFLSERVKVAIVTAGDLGSWMASETGTIHAAAMPVQSMDPTGAGDAFAAGFIAKYLTGATPLSWLEQGNRFGAMAIGSYGAGPAILRD